MKCLRDYSVMIEVSEGKFVCRKCGYEEVAKSGYEDREEKGSKDAVISTKSMALTPKVEEKPKKK